MTDPLIPAVRTRDPFRLDGPTAISVSGGRTSGYMLWRVLQANGGQLPPNAVAMFANTGKEEEATLRFVRDMAEHWSVPIVWIEYRNDAAGYAVVNFDSASREGEPFEAIVRKRQYLPNPVTRFCTSELKIRAMHKHLRALGWLDQFDGWQQFIGIRADEPRRVAKIRSRGVSTETSKEDMCMPLADAGVVLADVAAFWRGQPFALQLTTDAKGRTLDGNCDLCYLKPAAQILSLIRQKPQRAVWWARIEHEVASEFASTATGDGARFRNDRPSYAQMLAFAQDQAELFDADEEAIACFCGD